MFSPQCASPCGKDEARTAVLRIEFRSYSAFLDTEIFPEWFVGRKELIWAKCDFDFVAGVVNMAGVRPI
jgi:hypothetical protein